MAKIDEPPEVTLTSLVPGWIAPAFAGAAVATVPWIGFLAYTLPHTVEIHDRLAWVGFDIALVIMLALTAFLAWRRHPRLELAAIATGTMLVTDAWFDVLTSRHGIAQNTAIAFAVIELSMAGLCVWTAFRVRHRPDLER